MRYSETNEDEMIVREPRAIYVPVFDSFFESSIMNESVVTRFVFLALIRLACRPRAGGVVDVDPRIFAASINVPYADVETAIRRLMEPDPESGSKLEEGRRVVPVDPEHPMRCWRLVNWDGYKKLLHKANDKVRKSNQRSRDKVGQSGQSGHVTHDTIRNETKQDEKRERERFAPPTLEECKSFFEGEHLNGNAEAFFDHFEANGWRQGGRAPMRKWQAAARQWSRREGEFSSRPGASSKEPAYPSRDDVKAFSKAMVGANMEHYRDMFLKTFGVPLKEEKP